MKKLFLILIISMLLSPFILAQDAQPSSGHVIVCTIKSTESSDKPHRAPFHLDIEVLYFNETNALSVNSEEVSAEVYLYHNGIVVDYSLSIPTMFNLPHESGLYTIVIVGDSWTAEGCLEL